MNMTYIDEQHMDFQQFAGEERGSSRSVAPMDNVSAVIPTSVVVNNNLKSALRSAPRPVHHPVRTHLWLAISGVDVTSERDSQEDTFDMYADRIDHALIGDPNSVLPIGDLPVEMRAHHLLNEQGIRACHRVLYVLSETHPHIQQFSPMFYSLTCLLLHYTTESKCYSTLVAMLKRKDVEYFLTPSELALNASTYVLHHLATKYARQYVAAIETREACDFIDFLNDWMLWIFKHLPINYLVWITDCYLVEGYKVLFRIALILIKQYARSFCTGSDGSTFHVQRSECQIRTMCENITSYLPASKLMQQAFAIRGFSKKEVDHLFQRCEMDIRNKQSNPRVMISEPPQHGTSGPVLMRGSKKAMLADLGKKKSFKLDNQMHTQLLLEDVHSDILEKSQQSMIWSWLPPVQSVKEAELVFTTLEHGYSLKTFYEKVDNIGPILIIIRTVEGEVFGAYCSVDWVRRHSSLDSSQLSYFGTGESFVFTVSPETVYRWVGVARAAVPNECSMFQAGDKSMLMIGGGDGCAIQLDADLDHGCTSGCLTYDNPPLIQCHKQSRVAEFRIQCLEAFAFLY